MYNAKKPLQTPSTVSTCLENLTICELNDIKSQDLQQINNIFKKGRLPNLTELQISTNHNAKLDTFLDEFDPHKTVKLGKLVLNRFIISGKGLEILSEKLSSIRLTELYLNWGLGCTGNLSVLFAHSFPTLNTLILRDCELNSNDLQSLARANVEGKLPQLRHLDIYMNDVGISDLFTHSAQWNQLKTLRTSDVSVLNVEPECLPSLHTKSFQRLEIPSVSRRWSRLKVIDVWDDDSACCIADGVEQGMFPSLTTLRYSRKGYKNPFFFKLLKANISVEWV